MHHPISYNEIVTTVAKALFSLGVPPGVDTESAKNIAWLEANRLGGVSILADEIATIDNLGQWPTPEIENADEQLTITSSMPSSLVLAQMVIDFAEIGKPVTINACSVPLIIFAEAARRATTSKGFKLKWVVDGIMIEGICGSGWSDINIPAQYKSSTANVMITSHNSERPPTAAIYDEHYNYSLSNGMIVDPERWNIINQLAKTTLVPSSIHSRASAGAEVDDSN
tara:strand:- start:58 stop:735 length:678 start_codon:yes stop_codon:yes gene_type:complete